MTTNDIHMASGPNESAYVPEQLRAGDGDFLTRSDVIEAGQVLPQYRVVARETSSGKLVAWNAAGADGTNVAVGITCYAVDATVGDVEAAIYVSGYFNTDALVWGTATDAQKRAAFDRTAITHRKPYVSVG